MSSHVRTALVGLGVALVCLTMASLKGHQLLMAFAAASLAGGIYTWMQKHSQKPSPRQPRQVANNAARSRRMRASGNNNVYPFPAAPAWQMSDASGS
jgi:hypothetical protein